MFSKKDNKRELISVVLYTITLIMILTRKYMISILREDIPIDAITKVLFYGSIALLFLQVLIRKKHNTTEIILFLLSCILYVFTREGSILVIMLLAISIRDIKDSYVVKTYMLINVIFVIACVLIGNLGQHIAQVPQVHYRVIEGEYIVRETFGFANPNSAFLFLVPVFAGYLYLRYDKYNMIDRLILFSTVIFMYLKTRSNTGFLAILGVLIFVEIIRVINLKRNKPIQMLIKCSPIIFLAGSVIIATVFSNLEILNRTLSSRPKHWHAYLVEYKGMFSLFGQHFSKAIRAAHPLDNSYVYLLAFTGILSLLLFMYLLYKGLGIFIQKDQKKYIVITILFLVYSIAENIILEAGYNVAVVLLIKHVINNNPNNFTIKEGIQMLRSKKQC